MSVARLITGLALLSAAGCLRKTEFSCETNADCSSGTCQPIGFCSFADPHCPSGSRFGEFSGALSNQCTGGPSLDGGLDGTIDAPPDAPQGCPGSYVAITGGTTNHRYRLLTAGSNWQMRRDACAVDGTFLSVPDDQTELDAILVLAGSTIWVGVTDLAVEGTFTTVLNMPATFLPWDTGQPDDDNPGEDCALASNLTGKLTDERCNVSQRAVCECTLP